MSTVQVKDGKKVMRVRFNVNIEEVKQDYRPIKWPYAHPYWCSGESMEDFILVAYASSEAEIMEFWPEAKNLDVMETDLDHYTFSSRFAQPTWFKG